MANRPSYIKAASNAIAKANKDGALDPGLVVMLAQYAKQLDDLLYEGPMYKATLLRVSELKNAPDPALLALAIKLARDMDRSTKNNASTAKEYRETIKLITASEVDKAKTFDDQLADILDGK